MSIYIIYNHQDIELIHNSFSVYHSRFSGFDVSLSQISFYIYIAYTKSLYNLYSNFYSSK